MASDSGSNFRFIKILLFVFTFFYCLSFCSEIYATFYTAYDIVNITSTSYENNIKIYVSFNQDDDIFSTRIHTAILFYKINMSKSWSASYLKRVYDSIYEADIPLNISDIKESEIRFFIYLIDNVGNVTTEIPKIYDENIRVLIEEENKKNSDLSKKDISNYGIFAYENNNISFFMNSNNDNIENEEAKFIVFNTDISENIGNGYGYNINIKEIVKCKELNEKRNVLFKSNFLLTNYGMISRDKSYKSTNASIECRDDNVIVSFNKSDFNNSFLKGKMVVYWIREYDGEEKYSSYYSILFKEHLCMIKDGKINDCYTRHEK